MYQLQRLLAEEVPTDIPWPISSANVPWVDAGMPWYGTGTDVRMHIYNLPDTPAATNPPAEGDLPEHLLLLLQPLADGSGTVVSWSGYRRIFPQTGHPGFAQTGTFPTETLDLLILWNPQSLHPPELTDLTDPPLVEWPQEALDQWTEISAAMPDIPSGDGSDGSGGFEAGGESAPPPVAGENHARLWRVREIWPDSDGDGLYDWEELGGIALWWSNPFSADTDGDGWTDGIEQAYAASATDGNSQPQPSTTDGFPPPPPTDPFVPDVFSGLQYGTLLEQRLHLQNTWSITDYTDPEWTDFALSSCSGSLSPLLDPDEDVFSEVVEAYLPLFGTHMANHPFRAGHEPNMWSFGSTSREGFAHYDYQYSSSTFSTHGHNRVDLEHKAIRLGSKKVSPAPTEFVAVPRDVSVTCIRTIERGPAYLETGPTTYELDPENPIETFTIPAGGHLSSQEVRLEPFPIPDLNIAHHLDPVRIVAGAVTQYEVPMNPGWGHFGFAPDPANPSGDWIERFDDDLFPEKGKTFRIIIPLRFLAAETPPRDHINVRVWTTDRSGAVLDDPNPVRFERYSTVEFRSPPSIITPDADDDAFNGHLTDGVNEDPDYADEGIKDSSHHGVLGGTLHVQIAEGQGLDPWTFTFPIELPKAKLDARMIVVKKKVVISSDNPNYPQQIAENDARVVEAERQMRIATEIYAQAGIDLDWGSSPLWRYEGDERPDEIVLKNVLADGHVSVYAQSSSMPGRSGKLPPGSEARQIMNALGPGPYSGGMLVVVALPVFLLDFLREGIGARGLAIMDGNTPTGWSFIAIDRLKDTEVQDEYGSTTAHEIGHHVIRGIGRDHQRFVSGGWTDVLSFYLMTRGTNFQSSADIRTATKRLSSTDIYELLNQASLFDPLIWTPDAMNRFLISP